jgi:hypothetical protein
MLAVNLSKSQMQRLNLTSTPIAVSFVFPQVHRKRKSRGDKKFTNHKRALISILQNLLLQNHVAFFLKGRHPYQTPGS